MLKFFDDAKLKAAVWWRERREKAEERKAAHAEPPGVTIPLSLVRSAKLAAWMAYFSLVYFLWLYTLDIARDRAASLHLTHVGAWIGEIQFYFPYIVGFAIVAIGIPYVAKIAIPTFMSLSWRGNFWPKLWALFIAVAVSLVVIAGTFTVQGDTILERDRDAAVAVENVQQGRAALEAQIESRRQELADMMNNSNAYLAQAASVGAAEWERSYIAQARATNDPRLPMIERALGAARSADTARAEINTLRQQLAQSQTVASVQETVTTERTGWIADTLGWLEGARAMLLSFVMDIVCLIMPWIALRLEQARNRQVGMAGGIPQHPWMLEKPREGERPMVRPEEFAGRRAQDVVDAMIAGGADPRFAADMARAAARATAPDELAFDEDGTPLTKVEYWKRQDGKPLVKNQRNKVVVTPGAPPPDERGVATDGGNRIGSIAEAINDLGMIVGTGAEGGVEESERAEEGNTATSDGNPDSGNARVEVRAEEEQEQNPSGADGSSNSLQSSDTIEQPDLPDLTEDDAAFLDEAPVEPVSADEREEPETDERRMIAANVAAE